MITRGHCEEFSLIAKPLTIWQITLSREVQGQEGHRAHSMWPYGHVFFSPTFQGLLVESLGPGSHGKPFWLLTWRHSKQEATEISVHGFSDLGTCNLIQFVLQAVLLGNRYYKHKCLKSKRFQLPFLKTNSFVFQPLDKVRFRMLVWRERGRTNLLRIVKEGREMKHFLKRYKICIYIYIYFSNFS